MPAAFAAETPYDLAAYGTDMPVLTVNTAGTDLFLWDRNNNGTYGTDYAFAALAKAVERKHLLSIMWVLGGGGSSLIPPQQRYSSDMSAFGE